MNPRSVFKDLLRLFSHHGLQRWMIIHAFYNGVTQAVRSTIDVAIGGSLMNKTKDEAYGLIEEMMLNNFQWSTERAQPAPDNPIFSHIMHHEGPTPLHRST